MRAGVSENKNRSKNGRASANYAHGSFVLEPAETLLISIC